MRPPIADTLQQAAGDRARERGLAAGDAAKEVGDALGRLALEQVAGRAGSDRGEQVLLGAAGGENDDLGLRRRLADRRQRGQPVHAGHREVEQHERRAQPARQRDRLGAVGCLADDVEAMLLEQRGKRLACEGMVVDDEDALRHLCPYRQHSTADEGKVHAAHVRTYRSWLAGELAIVCLLALGTVVLAATGRLGGYTLPETRLVLDTAVAVVASIVAVLVSIRFRVEGRSLDLLLTAGFAVIALGTFVYGVAPKLDDGDLANREVWAMLGVELLAAALIAAAPFATARLSARRRMLAVAFTGASRPSPVSAGSSRSSARTARS